MYILYIYMWGEKVFKIILLGKLCNHDIIFTSANIYLGYLVFLHCNDSGNKSLSINQRYHAYTYVKQVFAFNSLLILYDLH